VLFALKLPPGLLKNGTEAERAGRYSSANLMRWFEGALGPIGGWRRRFTSQTAFTGVGRALLAWRENAGSRWLAVGTPSKLYAIASGGAITDITPSGFTAGDDDATAARGYGRGLYGTGTYGSPRPDTGTVVPATTWSLDTWGENLVGCSDADGDLYEWALDTGVDAAAITNAPTGQDALLVTPERFLVAFAGRTVTWSDQEDNTVWTPASTNQAGDFVLPTNGGIQQGLKLQSGFLVLTTTDAWQASYLDPTYVYGFRRVGEGCGAISRKSGVSTDTKAVWMGQDGFYSFEGYVERIPCDISEYVFGDLNTAQKSKSWAEHRAEFGEVWFHYVSGSATECDRVAVLNYREGHWTTHDLARTCGTDKGVYNNPIFVDPDGYLWDSEVGYSWGATFPHLETAPFRMGQGDYLTEVQRVIPDETNLGDVQVSFKARAFPTSAETTYGPYPAANPTDVLFQAGQVVVRFVATVTAKFRIGGFKLDVKRGDPLL
jgi:hypothetical protein